MDQKNYDLFSNKADLYKMFRPTYPAQLIEHLYSKAGFTKDSVIADIGSGTGIFSRLLIAQGSFVYCVEPNDDMRRAAEEDLKSHANFCSVGAPAENTGLEDKSVDFITVAQAIHWFDRQPFKRECQRILKPGGKLVLVWNERDYESEVIKKDFAIRAKYAVDKKGLGSGVGKKHGYHDLFVDGVREYLVFNNDLHLDRDDYIGRNLSTSYAPREEANPEEYAGLMREMNAFFDEYSSDGILNYPHFTQVHIGDV